MNRTTKQLLAVSAAGTALAFAAHYRISRFIVSAALDRQIPRIPGSAGKPAAPDSAVLETIRRASAQLRGSGCQTVELRAADGTPLAGHWRPHPQPRRVIIAMHGWRSSWDHDFGAASEFWQKNGCSVLYAEQRGQGLSGGECMGFGLLERYDCLDWANWVVQTTGGSLPIYFNGISMGASTVMMASELAMPEQVRGIIADCGYTSPDAIWRHVVETSLRLPYGLYRGTVNRLCRRKLRCPTDASCPASLARSRLPVLFLHGSADRFVPVEMTYENYSACTAPKYLHIVPGATHGLSYLTDRPGCEQATLDFWNRYDR